MAIMIPSQIADDAQVFEKYLFDKFRAIPAKWLILHSVFVNKTESDTPPRELDFVIIVPKQYAVVYLEAKSGAYRYHNRQWLRGNNDMPDRRSPPEQARSGMFVLKNKFEARLRENSEYGSPVICFGNAVAFADSNVTEAAEEEEDINKGTLLIGNDDVQTGQSIVECLGAYAKRMRQRSTSIGRTSIALQIAELQIKFLEEMLNPSDIAITTGGFYRSNLETLLPELLKPTPEQATLLNLTSMNSRCRIDGAAGTGKTVLAMELARQRCEENGEIVGLLCSNPNLSSRFERWAETLSNEKGGKVMAGTPTTLLCSTFENDEVFLARHRQRVEAAPNLEGTLKRGDLDNGWREFVDETLADLGGMPPLFDYLIVDEAQNLCDDVFLKLMNQQLKGGLVNGRWAMFGDFANQNIVSSRSQGGSDKEKASLAAFGCSYTNAGLRVNCRNTHEIAEAIFDITNIPSPTLSGVHGPEVEFKYFESTNDIDEMLDNQLKEWQGYGFEPQQIVLLYADENVPFSENRTYGKWNLANIREVPPEGGVRVSGDESQFVRYSEIHDFQGLESDLVILVLPVTEGQSKVGGIVTLPHHNYLNRLFYIAMSRANVMLVVMADEGYQAHLEPILAPQPTS